MSKEEKIELILLYVKDLVDMWPTITLRTLGRATDKIRSLKEVLLLLNQ